MVATYVSFFAVPTVVALYLGRRRPERFSRYVIATLAMYAIGLISFRLFPTAPPWMAARDGFIPPIYRIDALIIHPGSYAQGLHLIGANDVAAMPSIHIAQTWLAIFALWFRGRLARTLGVLYGLTMMFAVVYLGEHWVLDAIAGFALSCGIWYLTRKLAPVKLPAVRRIFMRDSLPQQI
jgi:membrane-associated phospholipid phosphatase